MKKLLLALACIALSSCSVNKSISEECHQYASCVKGATITCYSNGVIIYNAEVALSHMSDGGSFKIVEKDGSRKRVKADCIVTDNPQGK